MKFEIFDRSSNETVDTLDCDMKSFRFYWSKQGNAKDYGFRILDEPSPVFQKRIIKDNFDGNGSLDFLPFTNDSCEKIAEFNGGLSSGEVHYALTQGQSIYTNFSRFYLE
jgi:hypothetical protein